MTHALTQRMSGRPQLVPLVNHARVSLRHTPREVSADAGYCSEANLAALGEREIKAYASTGRAKRPAEVTGRISGALTQKMGQKLKRARHRSRDRLRIQIVDPVFGQIRQARGFQAVQAEQVLICTAHDITKLAKAS
ncbi:hypothetical protein [Rhodoblastus acidophilus]|nr:hypothetical protein [Rhodoblastus acidophilus]PPQ34920.1 hypothetical protein CKO16_21585 [Rhodoblastus acidophilus]RAI16629.1 hypothetical protein CH337_20410 [Rhodoblastus acidophilus]